MRRRPGQGRSTPRGVGLVQALVVMACLGVLMSLGSLAVTRLQARWALAGLAQRWLEVLHMTRAQAVLQQVQVVVCAQTSGGECATAGLPAGWALGWGVYIDRNGNGQHEAAEPWLVQQPALGPFQHMRGNQNVAYRVVFAPSGQSNHQGGTWHLCDARLAQGWAVVINIIGRARLAPDEDGPCP